MLSECLCALLLCCCLKGFGNQQGDKLFLISTTKGRTMAKTKTFKALTFA